MKFLKFKKIPAVILTAAILFTCVFSMSIFANAASSYTPRLTAPDYNNKYYYSDLNVYYKYGYGMPNCTAYAFGRAYEILGYEPNLCWYNAEQWYGYNKNYGYYDYGQTPKLGAIACWSYNGGGHVAVVEKIENGIITFSNSAWNRYNFYLSTAKTSDPNAGGNSWWNFQGYIYITDIDDPTPEPTDAKTGIYRVNVDDYLNMRSGAGTSFSYVTSIPDGVKLNVTKIQKNGGYTWGYTTYNGKNGWVALDFCDFVSEYTEPETTVQPTTVQPTTVPPTTAQPTTIQPTTEPQTTVEPTTAEPTAATIATRPQPNKVPTQPATASPATEPAETQPKGLGIGDVNADGKIDVEDASIIQKYITGIISLTEEQVSWCDFDKDGYVSIDDVTSIQKYLTFYK